MKQKLWILLAALLVVGGVEAASQYLTLPQGRGIRFNGSVKPTITAGSGAPTATVPRSSAYLRTGGTTDTLWSYTNAGWKNAALENTTVGFTQVTGTLNIGQFVQAKDATQTLAGSASLAITSGKSFFPVAGSGGAVTGLGVASGTTDGKTITIIGTSDTNTCQFADAATLNLGSATRTLGLDDTLRLVWITDHWSELSFSNN